MYRIRIQGTSHFNTDPRGSGSEYKTRLSSSNFNWLIFVQPTEYWKRWKKRATVMRLQVKPPSTPPQENKVKAASSTYSLLDKYRYFYTDLLLFLLLFSKYHFSRKVMKLAYRYTGVRFYPPFIWPSLTSGMLMDGCVHFSEFFFAQWEVTGFLCSLRRPGQRGMMVIRFPGQRGVTSGNFEFFKLIMVPSMCGIAPS